MSSKHFCNLEFAPCETIVDQLHCEIEEHDFHGKKQEITLKFKYDEEIARDTTWTIVLQNDIGSSSITVKPMIDPKLSEWSSWSSCTVTCHTSKEDFGKKTRTRTCTEGINSSKNCSTLLGNGMEMDICAGDEQFDRRCPIDCKWRQWTSWTACSATCGEGKKTRTRSTIPARYGGKGCQENEETEIQTENCGVRQQCIYCEVEDWSVWSACAGLLHMLGFSNDLLYLCILMSRHRRYVCITGWFPCG